MEIVNIAAPNVMQWDFHKTAKNKDSQIIHYYDSYAQEIYPSQNGLRTVYTKVEEGHWSTSEFTKDPVAINNDPCDILRTDHPINGTLYMTYISNNFIHFLRYRYMVDISDILTDWRQQFKNDNCISDLTINVKNINPDAFTGRTSVFLPGAKIDASVVFDTHEMQVGVYWLDQISIDPTKETVNISSRNYSGHFLTDQTMNELGLKAMTGTTIDLVKKIFEFAGITEYLIDSKLTQTCKFEFKPEDTIYSALDKITQEAKNPDPSQELVILEHSSGKILFGRRNWIDQYMQNSYYSFEAGREVFRRNTEKCIDGAYSSVMVTGEMKSEDTQKPKHTPIILPVKNFPYWYVKKNKTKHVESDTPMTVDEFRKFAEAQAESLQFMGIGEDLEGPYRPQLYIGDIAEIKNSSGVGMTLGLINQIEHNFSVDEGFTTSFVVDSGGVAIDGADYVVYSTSGKDNGRNRRMNMVDVIKILTNK